MQVISTEWKYDLHSDHEDGAEILSGNSSSLEQLIHNGGTPALYRLSEDLFKALDTVNTDRRWFADICEKCVLVSKDGRFSLSIPGNTISRNVLPDTAIYASKEYWMPVFAYLIGRVRLNELRPGELPGILFNYLQTMLLLLRVRLVFVDQEGYYNSDALFDQLPIILDKLVPEFRALFTRLLVRNDKTPNPSDLKQIKTLFMEKVVLRKNELDEPPAAVPVVRPVVRPLKRNADYLQNGDFVVAVILAVALTFSAWLWSGH